MAARSDCALSSKVPLNSRPSAIALTSPPAQNPRPAPVSTTAPTSASSARRGSASSSPSSIGRDMAFSRSGRLRVSTATPSLIVSSRSWFIALPPSPGSRPRRSQAEAHHPLRRVVLERAQVGAHALDERLVVGELAGEVAARLLGVEVQVVEPRIRVVLGDAGEAAGPVDVAVVVA